jgi:hypothetical protein
MGSRHEHQLHNFYEMSSLHQKNGSSINQRFTGSAGVSYTWNDWQGESMDWQVAPGFCKHQKTIPMRQHPRARRIQIRRLAQDPFRW